MQGATNGKSAQGFAFASSCPFDRTYTFGTLLTIGWKDVSLKHNIEELAKWLAKVFDWCYDELKQLWEA